MHISILGSQKSIHTVRWANALVKKGFNIDVITMHEANEKFHPSVNVIQLYFSNPHGYILNIPQLRNILRKLKPDILHVFYAFGYGFLGRMSGYKPLVLSVMGSDVYDDINRSWLFKRIIVSNLKKASKLCSTSYVMKKQIDSLLKGGKDVSVTPFGVNLGLFSPNRSKSEDFFTIGTVKFLEIKYGVDLLIKSFSRLCKMYPSEKFKLIIAGEGSQRKKLEDLAYELGISEDCEFLGYVPNNEIPDLLNSFDIYAALSRFDSESFGVAILEASACGRPVVVTDVGGLPEVVNDGITGLVIAKENVNEAVSAFDKLFSNRKLSEDLGINGEKHVESKYSWSSSVNIMINVYHSIC